MKPEPSPKQTKATMVAILGAFVACILMLSFVSTTMGAKAATSTPDGTRTLFYGLAVASAVACAFWSFTRLSFVGQVGDTPKPPPVAKFHTDVLTALAFAELPTLLGFVNGMGGESIWPMSGLSLACIAVFVAPRVLAYWKAVEGG